MLTKAIHSAPIGPDVCERRCPLILQYGKEKIIRLFLAEFDANVTILNAAEYAGNVVPDLFDIMGVWSRQTSRNCVCLSVASASRAAELFRQVARSLKLFLLLDQKGLHARPTAVVWFSLWVINGRLFYGNLKYLCLFCWIYSF